MWEGELTRNSCLAQERVLSALAYSAGTMLRLLLWMYWLARRDVELAKFEAFLKNQNVLNIKANVRGRQRLAYPIKRCAAEAMSGAIFECGAQQWQAAASAPLKEVHMVAGVRAHPVPTSLSGLSSSCAGRRAAAAGAVVDGSGGGSRESCGS